MPLTRFGQDVLGGMIIGYQTKILAPGGSFSVTLPLHRLFDLTKPDVYALVVKDDVRIRSSTGGDSVPVSLVSKPLRFVVYDPVHGPLRVPAGWPDPVNNKEA